MPRMWRNPYDPAHPPPPGDEQQPPRPVATDPTAMAALAAYQAQQAHAQQQHAYHTTPYYGAPPAAYPPPQYPPPNAAHWMHAPPPAQAAVAMEEDEEEEEDDDDDEEEDEEIVAATVVVPVAPYVPQKEPRAALAPPPRGKPEAMAIQLAAVQAETVRDELAAVAVASDDDEDEEAVTPVVVVAAVERKPAPATPPPPKKKATSTTARKKPKTPVAAAAPRTELLLDEPPAPITTAEYENVQALLTQFCRVPLLAEFSRPVALLHPELAANYEKIVKHPVDLGHVCRGIRRREYQNTRDVRLDMWRVFANCVKFHSHPHNKEAVPTFVSIALHLREYFNSLWQEYMLPAEIPRNASVVLGQGFQKRRDDRRKRIDNSGVLMMSSRFLMKVAGLLESFIKKGGCIDSLDHTPIFTDAILVQNRDLRDVVQNFNTYRERLETMAVRQEDHSIDELIENLKRCYTADDVLEEFPLLRLQFQNRLDRLVGKLYAPLHEANSRGVTQSSIWGNIATTIWARESSKKAYWPALCLGILPPADQREDWHDAVTERNEARLPEKLRAQLMGAKKKCEAQQKKQSLSYFLVEFLGTHEFIWVRETDIVEKFDRNQDPNKIANVKKKRASRNAISNVVGSKTYSTALEECEWATEEFEQLLQEAFDYDSDQEVGDDDGEFMNYSYALLNQSDEEADDVGDHEYKYIDDDMSVSDVDESNWLIMHEGNIDTSVAGRKNAKKRTQAVRKKIADSQKKKASVETAKKETKKKKPPPKPDNKAKSREEKKERKELEKRRKKRSRDREKIIREDKKKLKRKRMSIGVEEDERGLVLNKRQRASAIVKAYLNRMASADDYKSLALGGVMSLPGSAVDPTGLLATALAFRAAAGQFTMPDETEESDAAKFKPWTKIDADSPLTHQERADKLKQKVDLLEKEIERVKANAKKRREMTADALEDKLARESQIFADDSQARINPYKKKKKTLDAKVDDKNEKLETPAGKSKSSESVAADVGEEDDDNTEAEPAEVMSDEGDAVESPSLAIPTVLQAAFGDSDEE